MLQLRQTLILALTAVALSPPARAQSSGSPSAGPRLRIGVLDLSGSALKLQISQNSAGQPGGGPLQTTGSVAIAPPAEFARALTEILTSVLVGTNRFVVLERAQLQAVQQEQDLGGSGRVNRETAATGGSLIGAQVLITGDITGFSYTSQEAGGQVANLLKGLSTSVARVRAAVTIDLRILDAVTGEVIGSAEGRGEATATGLVADLTKDDRRLSGSIGTNTPLAKGSREALQNAVAELLITLPRIAWVGRVIEVRDGAVYLNAGAEDGMAVGMAFDVYEPTPALIDPSSGRNLGSPDRLVGRIELTEVRARYSVAKALLGEGFKRNYVVRPKVGSTD